MEEDRDHIDRDKDYGSAYSGHGEEDEYSPRLEKLYREDTSASSSENGVNLLKSQEDEEDTRIAEEADGLSGILVVGYTAEGHGYDAGGEGSYSENTSDVVHLTSAVH